MLDRCTAVILQAIEDAEIRIDKVSKVFLVGGTTKIPEFRDAVEGLFVTRKPMIYSAEDRADECIVYGTARKLAINKRMTCDPIVPTRSQEQSARKPKGGREPPNNSFVGQPDDSGYKATSTRIFPRKKNREPESQERLH